VISNRQMQTSVRVAWGYRSELAPFPVAGAVFVAGWWAHLGTPHWYPLFIAGSAAAAWLLVTFGAWLGLPWLADRVYAGLALFAAGAWVAFAALLGYPVCPRGRVGLARMAPAGLRADGRGRYRAGSGDRIGPRDRARCGARLPSP
jgi:hypothetical protein